MSNLWWYQSYRNSTSHMRYLNCLLNRRYMQWYTRSSLENGIFFLSFQDTRLWRKKLASISWQIQLKSFELQDTTDCNLYISNWVNTMIWFEDSLTCSRGWAVLAFWLNQVSIHPVVLKKIFKDFQFFNQLEAMSDIFNTRQGQRTQFWKRSIQRVSHQSLVQFDVVVLEKIKCEKLTDDRRQTQSDGKSSFESSALVN